MASRSPIKRDSRSRSPPTDRLPFRVRKPPAARENQDSLAFSIPVPPTTSQGTEFCYRGCSIRDFNAEVRYPTNLIDFPKAETPVGAPPAISSPNTFGSISRLRDLDLKLREQTAFVQCMRQLEIDPAKANEATLASIQNLISVTGMRIKAEDAAKDKGTGSEMSESARAALRDLEYGATNQRNQDRIKDMVLEEKREKLHVSTSPITPPGSPFHAVSSRDYPELPASDGIREEWVKDGSFEVLMPYLGSAPRPRPQDHSNDPDEKPVTGSPREDFTTRSFFPMGTVMARGGGLPCIDSRCPIAHDHLKGAYLQQGEVPRVFNERWGYSDPPQEIWHAWANANKGTANVRENGKVDGFAACHEWGGRL